MKYRLLKKRRLRGKRKLFCDCIVRYDREDHHLIKCRNQAEFSVDVILGKHKAVWYICSDCLERVDFED